MLANLAVEEPVFSAKRQVRHTDVGADEGHWPGGTKCCFFNLSPNVSARRSKNLYFRIVPDRRCWLLKSNRH